MKAKMLIPQLLVLDAVFKDYRRHWLDKIYWTTWSSDSEEHFEKIKKYDDGHDLYGDVIERVPDIYRSGMQFDSWRNILVVTRDADVLMLFYRDYYRHDTGKYVSSRVLAFTNNDNFWTYFMLKYR